MYLIANLSQFVFNTACGVVSDKLRRPTYMTILSLLIVASLATYFTFIPKVSETIEEKQSFSSLYCGEMDYTPVEINRTCDSDLQIVPCEEMCNQESCCKDIPMNKLNLIEKFINNIMPRFNNGSEYDFDWCTRDSKTALFANSTQTICGVYKKACEMTCLEYKSATADRKGRVLFLIAIAILFFTFDENVYRFLDILANYMAKSYEAEYGRQIFWSNIGSLTGPSLVALIIQLASTPEESNYESSLYFYSAGAVLTIALVCTLKVSQEKPTQEMSKAAMKLFGNVDFLFFIFILFVLGGTWGFLMSFHNLFLENIGTPIYMMGLLDTFSSACGLPVLVTGKWLTDKIGHSNVFILALLGYFFKCFGYSFIRVAWPVFFLELFMMLSYHLLWVATIDYCTIIGPESLKGTVIMLAGTVHFSLGRAIGSFAGGLLMSAYGAPAAFRIMAAANGVTFLLYSVYLYIRRSQKIKKFDVS